MEPSLFVDVSKTDTKIQRQWSKKAPDWRKVSPGLTLEGNCQNKECKLLNQVFW